MIQKMAKMFPNPSRSSDVDDSVSAGRNRLNQVIVLTKIVIAKVICRLFTEYTISVHGRTIKGADTEYPPHLAAQSAPFQ